MEMKRWREMRSINTTKKKVIYSQYHNISIYAKAHVINSSAKPTLSFKFYEKCFQVKLPGHVLHQNPVFFFQSV